jgi:hypothetical protein
MTLSVPAKATPDCFFFDLILTSVRHYTLLFYLPNFLSFGQMKEHNLTLVASGCGSTISLTSVEALFK